MREPKVIKIVRRIDPILKDIGDDPIPCMIHNREDDDLSEIVYIVNPYYKKNTKENPITGAPYISITGGDYEVIEWTED